MRIDLNSSDLRFLSRHADRLAGLPISVGNRRDDSGAWLGTFRHARVYLAGKPVRLDGPGDGCTCVEIRGNAAGPVEAEQLAEAVALWPLAVAAVARHIEGMDPAAWSCERIDVPTAILGGPEGWEGLRDFGADPTPTEWDLITHAAELAWVAALR
jgi:hypothetical protein